MWTAVLIASIVCVALKTLGYLIPPKWLEAPRPARIADLLTVALLAALVAVQTFGAGQAIVVDARLPPILVAAGLLLMWSASLQLLRRPKVPTCTRTPESPSCGEKKRCPWLCPATSSASGIRPCPLVDEVTGAIVFTSAAERAAICEVRLRRFRASFCTLGGTLSAGEVSRYPPA